MVTFLAQAATDTSAQASQSIVTYMQSVFQQIIGIDVMLAIRIILIWIFLIWLVFALWVAIDAGARYRQWQVAVLWFLFVLPFNILGFIGYLFMRPVVTIEEHQWTKLESKYLMHELSSVNDCPMCGTLVPVTQNYCAVCGTQMNVTCGKCGAMQSIYNLYCSGCGEKLGEEVKKEEKGKNKVHREPILQSLGSAIIAAKNSVTTKTSQFVSKVFAKKPKVAKDGNKVEEAQVTADTATSSTDGKTAE